MNLNLNAKHRSKRELDLKFKIFFILAASKIAQYNQIKTLRSVLTITVFI